MVCPPWSWSAGRAIPFAGCSGGLVSRVSGNHLHVVSLNNNRAPLLAGLGIPDSDYHTTDDRVLKFCSLHYGYPANGGGWPTSNHGDYAALTRLAKATMALLHSPARQKARAKQRAEAEKAAAARAAARAAKLAGLPAGAVAACNYLLDHPASFGCQREHVLGVVAALTATDVRKLQKAFSAASAVPVAIAAAR